MCFLFLLSILGLDFYHQVKIVNYIRRQVSSPNVGLCKVLLDYWRTQYWWYAFRTRQVYRHNCVKCQENFPSRLAVLEHMEKGQHFALPEDKTVWDQPLWVSSFLNDLSPFTVKSSQKYSFYTLNCKYPCTKQRKEKYHSSQSKKKNFFGLCFVGIFSRHMKTTHCCAVWKMMKMTKRGLKAKLRQEAITSATSNQINGTCMRT